MINYVGQVGHRFVAFVKRCRENIGVGTGIFRGIDDVNGALPAVVKIDLN